MSLGNRDPREPELAEVPSHIQLAGLGVEKPSMEERLELTNWGVRLGRVAIVAGETSRGRPTDQDDPFMNSVRSTLDELLDDGYTTLKKLIMRNLGSKSEEPLDTETINEALARLRATLEDIISGRIQPEDPRLLQLKDLAFEIGEDIRNKLGKTGVL